MGIAKVIGNAIKAVLDATDPGPEYGDLRWHELTGGADHVRGRIFTKGKEVRYRYRDGSVHTMVNFSRELNDDDKFRDDALNSQLDEYGAGF